MKIGEFIYLIIVAIGIPFVLYISSLIFFGNYNIHFNKLTSIVLTALTFVFILVIGFIINGKNDDLEQSSEQ